MIQKLKSTDRDAKKLAIKWAAPAKAEKGKQLAQQGKSDQALTELNDALTLNPNLDLDPETQIKDRDAKKLVIKWAAPGKVEKAQQLARQGE